VITERGEWTRLAVRFIRIMGPMTRLELKRELRQRVPSVDRMAVDLQPLVAAKILGVRERDGEGPAGVRVIEYYLVREDTDE
jgi:hypothetical protein